MSMSNTWKQEIADAITPIEGVNDITASLKWNIQTIQSEPFSPIPQTEVVIQRTVVVKGASDVDARLIDGKNYISGDHKTEIAYSKYLTARVPLSTDPQIISGGVVKTLEEMRPMTKSYGIEQGIDTLTIAGSVWSICGVDAVGMLNNESGIPVPAKLRITLRREKKAM